MTPVLTGQTDAVSGWITNTTTLKPLGPDRIDLRLWDAGVRLYALPYYAHQGHDREEGRHAGPPIPGRCRRAGSTHSRTPRRRSISWSRNIPTSSATTKSKAARTLLTFAFNANTQANGWGAFDPAVWSEQIKLYDDLKQFSAGPPKLEDVINYQRSSTPPRPSAPKSAERDGNTALATDAVRCERVSVRFTTERGTVTALENIDLTIPRGSFLTLLGPSGCGKSTLLRVWPT